MKILHKDQFSEMLFDEQKGIFYHNMFPETKNMEEEDFKEMLITWKNFVNLYKADKATIDSKNLFFPMTPEIQQWIVDEINAKVTIENTKTAFLMPEDFILTLAAEQYIDEANDTGRETRYFSTIEEAEDWLLS